MGPFHKEPDAPMPFLPELERDLCAAHMAVLTSDTAGLRMVLAKRAEINGNSFAEGCTRTLLQAACFLKFEAVVMLVAAPGTDVNFRGPPPMDQKRPIALLLADLEFSLPSFDAILPLLPEIEQDMVLAHIAVLALDLHRLRLILEKRGGEINGNSYMDGAECTLLQNACRLHFKEGMRLLLDTPGTDVNYTPPPPMNTKRPIVLMLVGSRSLCCRFSRDHIVEMCVMDLLDLFQGRTPRLELNYVTDAYDQAAIAVYTRNRRDANHLSNERVVLRLMRMGCTSLICAIIPIALRESIYNRLRILALLYGRTALPSEIYRLVYKKL